MSALVGRLTAWELAWCKVRADDIMALQAGRDEGKGESDRDKAKRLLDTLQGTWAEAGFGHSIGADIEETSVLEWGRTGDVRGFQVRGSIYSSAHLIVFGKDKPELICVQVTAKECGYWKVNGWRIARDVQNSLAAREIALDKCRPGSALQYWLKPNLLYPMV